MTATVFTGGPGAPGPKKGRGAVAGFVLSAFLFTLVTAAGVTAPTPVRAQVPALPVVDIGNLIDKKVTDAFVEAAVTAVVNGANYFTSQLAYQAALALTSECPGQTVCWDSKSFGQGFREAWQGAVGETVGTLSDQAGFTALGFNLCKPSADFSLQIQLGLLNDLKPAAPRCDFGSLVSNWDAFSQSVSTGEVLRGLKPVFTPGQSPLSVSLGAFDGAFGRRIDAEREQVTKKIMDAAAGGGFSEIRDPVSGRVKSPAAVTADEFARSRKGEQSAIDATQQANAGSIARGAVFSVVLNTAQTFTMTLVSRLVNKLASGLLSTQELIALQPDLILNAESLLQPLGSAGVGSSLAARYLIATPREAGVIDPLLQFSVCPGVARGPNNCVVDQQFASAVRVADTAPMTVRDAIDKGMLHGEWPLISAADRPKDQDPFCYTYGYCESNLKKLRAARIIPIGWEIAASRSSVSNPAKLKDIVAAFSDCGPGGQIDDAHPWCKLIDPDWVLRAPLTQCRAMGWSDALVSQDTATRAEQCLDTQTCLRQDDKGQCIGGWGYCTRERNVWRLGGDSCPAAYNTCRTLTTADGAVRNYLLNTLDRGVCNADNAGCRRYALEVNGVSCQMSTTCSANDGCVCSRTLGSCSVLRNQDSCTTPEGQVCRLQGTCNAASCPCVATSSCRVTRGASSCVSASGDSKDPSDDWKADPALFLNKNVQSCDASNNGCSALIRLDQGQSLNLVKNPSFERLEDGDNDGTPDHAVDWTPFAKAPNGADGSLVLDGSKSSSGRNAIRPSATATSAACALTTACADELGCPCTVVGGAFDQYSCKVPKGLSRCSVTRAVTQTGLPAGDGDTYTFSFTAIPGTGSGVDAGATIRFTDANADPVTLAAGDVVVSFDAEGVSCQGGDDAGQPCTADAQCGGGGSCPLSLTHSVSGNAVAFSLVATKDADVKGVRASYTFAVAGKPVRHASLTLNAAGDYVDDVQLEEGEGTPFHDGYGAAGQAVNAKVPPASLGCTGDDGEPQECQSFAGMCRANEVGCDLFAPANGDPSIPGIANPQDRCPAECAGYDVFKQQASDFDAEKFPVHFIPDTARACTEAEVGCSQFTNLANENVEYYSRLRLCVRPEDSAVGTYYSWEGSDVSGYQLRVWSLKNTTDALGAVASVRKGTDAEVLANAASDVVANAADANAGAAPCTALDTNAEHCASVSLALPGGSTVGLCDRGDIDAGDFDCREFYDAAGNRHYRLLSKTIIASASCSQYRITTSTQADCRRSSGRWDAASGRCIYFADAAESRSCSAAQNGCRAYKGNASSNVRTLVTQDLESGIGEWKDQSDAAASSIAVSSESVTVGGHSLRIVANGAAGDASQARLEVGGSVAPLRSYTLSFWARGSGTLEAAFDAGRQDVQCSLSSSCQAGSGATCPCVTPAGLRCQVNAGQTSCTVRRFSTGAPDNDQVPTSANPNGSLAFADNEGSTPAPRINLSSEWKRYEVGPVSVAALTGTSRAWGSYPVKLVFNPRGTCVGGSLAGAACDASAQCGAGTCQAASDVYVDNVILREVQDNFYAVRDSWTTPASCDRTSAGTPSPQEMLGCKEYSTSTGQKATLRSFTSLCRERAVGCSAYSQTQQTLANPYAESFSAVCRLTEADGTTPRTCGAVRCELSCNSATGCDCNRTVAGVNYSCRVANGATFCDAPAPADAGASCACNYDTDHPRAAAGAPVVLADVCRVAIGSSECRFDLPAWDSSTRLDENPDRVNVSADKRAYLVVKPQHLCSADQIGCRVVGQAQETFEGLCQNKDANGAPITCSSSTPCRCTLGNATCDILPGDNGCSVSFERGVVEKWQPKAIKDLPAQYSRILCSVTATGCAAFATADGPVYFKDPGSKLCQFRESVNVGGQIRSGWFRTSTSGALFPCYPELLKNGQEYAMYKNADPVCRRSTVCAADGGCLCFLPSNPTTPACRIVKGGTACGYQGWVGQCEAQYDRCEEFVDPFQTTPNNPDGTPYYYLMNQKLDRASCAGAASLKQGCVLLQQTSNTARLYSAATTYFRSAQEANDAKVAPVNCDTTPHDPRCENRCFSIPTGVCSGNNALQCRSDAECRRCTNNAAQICSRDADCGGAVGSCPTTSQTCVGTRQYTTACGADADCNASAGERCAGPGLAYTIPAADQDVTRNDANVIVKVRPDRECSEWLACKSFETIWDAQKGQYRSICSGFSHCTENRQVGNAFECVSTVEPEREKLSREAYSRRDTSWAGQEYSGYTVWDRWSPSFLTPVSIVTGRCMQNATTPVDADAGTAGVQFRSCATSAECGSSNFCKPLTGVCQSAGILDGTSCDANVDCGGTSGNGFCSTNFLATHRFAVVPDPSRSCSTDAQCVAAVTGLSEDGACIARRCLYNFDGGKFDLTREEWAPRCRAFPEEDSPYGGSVIDTSAGGDHPGYGQYGEPRSRKTSFANANVCGRGNDCECSYSRWQYGQGATYTQYLSYPGSTNAGPVTYDGNTQLPVFNSPAEGICVGGPKEGRQCNPLQEGTENTCVKDDGGRCQRLTAVNYVQGWQGFCMDLDKSMNVNGDQGRFGCNLWLPVDRLAGSPDTYNQFEEAGFQPKSSQLLYCKVAQGNQEGGTYKRSFHSEVDEDPVFRGATTNWFSVQGVDWEPRSTSTSSLGVFKNEMTGIQVEIKTADSRTQTQVDATNTNGVFYLGPENNWTNSLEWQSDNFPGSDTLGAKGLLPAAGGAVGAGTASGKFNFVGSGASGFCATWFSGDHETECDNRGSQSPRNCLAAQAVFDETGKFVEVRTNLCHSASANRNQTRVFDASVLLREQCVDVAMVHDASRLVKNAAWTDRLYQAAKGYAASADKDNYRAFGFLYAPRTARPSVTTPDLSPLGRIEPEALQFTFGTSGAKTLSVRFPVPVYASEGGSLYTYLDTSLPVGTVTLNNVVGKNPNVQQPDKPIVDVGGIPFACIGPCAQSPANNRGSRDAATSAGNASLQFWFASEYYRFVYDAEAGARDFTLPPGVPSVYVSGPGYPSYDVRAQVANDLPSRPYVLSVNTQDCAAGAEGLCEEGSIGLTVGTQNSGTITASRRYSALIRYYAYADKDRMPVRRKIIDFGDGSAPVPSPGAFKNHRGCAPGAASCADTAAAKVCGSADIWGLTDQSCDSRYFQESHTYTCTPSMVVGQSSLPDCSAVAANRQYPCKQDGQCRFKPRVQILDNWGYCNGSCPGGPAGTACFNEDKLTLGMNGTGNFGDDAYIAGLGGYAECHDLSNRRYGYASGKTPWTEFAGEIVISP